MSETSTPARAGNGPAGSGFLTGYSLAVIPCALVGALLSGYLLYLHYFTGSHSSVFFRLCSIGAFDCARVSASRYATLFGVPLASFGLLLYLFALVSVVLLYAFRRSREFVVFLAVLSFWLYAVAAFSVIPLAYISAFKIRSFCLFCVITWVCNAGLLFAAYVAVSRLGGEGGLSRTLNEEARDSLKELTGNIAPLLVMALMMALGIVSIAAMSLGMSSRAEMLQMREGLRMEDEILSNFYLRPQSGIDLRGVPVAYGSPSAKVTIVEYFSFDCSVCRRAKDVLKAIVDKYPGKVRVYLKNYPPDVSCIAPNPAMEPNPACRAALLSIALRGSRAYMNFVEYLMSQRLHISPQMIEVALANSGVNRAALQSLMPESEAVRILAGEITEAGSLRIEGTPTFVVNGRALPSGLPPFYFFDRLIGMEVNRVYGQGR